jgi:hypothetical protein
MLVILPRWFVCVKCQAKDLGKLFPFFVVTVEALRPGRPRR